MISLWNEYSAPIWFAANVDLKLYFGAVLLLLHQFGFKPAFLKYVFRFDVYWGNLHA